MFGIPCLSADRSDAEFMRDAPAVSDFTICTAPASSASGRAPDEARARNPRARAHLPSPLALFETRSSSFGKKYSCGGKARVSISVVDYALCRHGDKTYSSLTCNHSNVFRGKATAHSN